MAETQALTIRIGADASGAISVLGQTSTAVNNLGNNATNAGRGVNALNTNIYGTRDAAGLASNGVNNLNSNLGNIHRSANSASGALNSLKSLMGGLAGAFTLGKAISEIASFETKMLSLKALTMANTEQMKQMEMQARQLGATTAFSAQQAATAQGVLASSGLKANEILQATPKILELAAAGSMDLAKAAEYAMGSIKGFGLELADLGHLNNVFAKVAADSSTSVSEIGEAMKIAAPLSKAFSVSLDTTAAAIGVLANGQIKGSEAGNAFKSMLAALGNETKEKSEILKQHGLTYDDLNVQVKGTTKVLESIRNAGFTGAEGLTMFGQEAAAATLILSDNVDALHEAEIANKSVGEAAKEQADILNQGLSKAWDALGGTLSEAALQMGEVKSGGDSVLGGMTGLIQTITGVISIYEGLGQAFKESNNLTDEQYQHLQNVATGFSVVAGAATGIAALTGAIWLMNTAMVAFKATLALVSAHPIIAFSSVIALALGAAAGQAAAWNKDIDSQIEHSESRIKQFNDKTMLGGGLRKVGSMMGYDIAAEEENLAKLKILKAEQESLLAKSKVTPDPIDGMSGLTKAAALKLKGIKDYQQKMIDETAITQKIDANLIKAVISVESAFNPKATSPVGAIGLMQIMPANAKSLNTTSEALKNEATNIEKGTEFLAKMLKISGGRLDEAWANWNWGSGNVAKSKDAHGGMFNMGNAPEETQRSYSELITTLKLLKTTVADVERPARAAASAVASIGTETKKAQDKAYDSTAAGAFEKGVNELNAAFTEGTRDSYEYNSKFDALLSTYDKATGKIQSVSSSQRELNSLLAGTPQFELDKTMGRLNAQKSAGVINDYYYKNNATKAQDQFTEQTTGVNPSAEASKNATESGNAAKEAMQSAEQATKAYEDAVKSAGKATFDAGTSSTAIFDSMNSGIGKLVGSFDTLSASIAGHSTQFEGISESYQKNMKIEGLSAEQQANLTKLYYKDKQSYESAMQLSTLSGIRQIAGAGAALSGEQSRNRKALHAIEMAFSVIEIAMSIKKTAVNLAEGASKMFGQSGWFAFAGVAAMIAVVGTLGYKSGGNSTAEKPQEDTKTTGTVFGDKEKQSESMKNVIDTLKDIHTAEMPELKNITHAIHDMSTANDLMIKSLFEAGGLSIKDVPTTTKNTGIGGAIADFSKNIPVIGGLIESLGSILFGGKTTSTLKHTNLEFKAVAFSAIEDVSTELIKVTQIIANKKDGGLFSSDEKWDSKKYIDVGKPAQTAMNNLFITMGASVLAFWDYLGLEHKKGFDKLQNFKLSATTIDIKGKTDAQVQAIISNYTSQQFDLMITALFGGLINQYKKIGEASGDTMARLLLDTSAFQLALRKMGADTNGGKEELIAFGQGMIDAAGSVKSLISAMDNFTNKFTDSAAQLKISKDAVTAFMSDKENIIGLSNAGKGEGYALLQKLLDSTSFSNDTSAQSSKDLRASFASLGVDLLNATKDNHTQLLKNEIQASEASKLTKNTLGTTSVSGTAVTPTSTTDIYKNLPTLDTYVDSKNYNKQIAGLYEIGADTTLSYKETIGSASKNLAFGSADLTKIMDQTGLSFLQLADAFDKIIIEKDRTDKIANALKNDILKSISPGLSALRTQNDALNTLKGEKQSYTFGQKNADSASIAAQILLNNETLDLGATFSALKQEWNISASGLQKLSYSLAEAAKNTVAASNAMKTLMDMQKSITAWSAKTTAASTGNKETMLATTKALFDKQLVDTKSVDPQVARDAYTGITATADSYISALRGFYASTQTGQDLIKGVVDKVSALPAQVTVFDLMLEKLTDINNGIYKISSGLSPDSGTSLQHIIDAIEAARLLSLQPNATAVQGQNYAYLKDLLLGYQSAQQKGLSNVLLEKYIAALGSGSSALAAMKLNQASSYAANYKDAIGYFIEVAVHQLDPFISDAAANPQNITSQNALALRIDALNATMKITIADLMTATKTQYDTYNTLITNSMSIGNSPTAPINSAAAIPDNVINDAFYLSAQRVTATPVLVLQAINALGDGIAAAKNSIKAIEAEFTPIKQIPLVNFTSTSSIPVALADTQQRIADFIASSKANVKITATDETSRVLIEIESKINAMSGTTAKIAWLDTLIVGLKDVVAQLGLLKNPVDIAVTPSSEVSVATIAAKLKDLSALVLPVKSIGVDTVTGLKKIDEFNTAIKAIDNSSATVDINVTGLDGVKGDVAALWGIVKQPFIAAHITVTDDIQSKINAAILKVQQQSMIPSNYTIASISVGVITAQAAIDALHQQMLEIVQMSSQKFKLEGTAVITGLTEMITMLKWLNEFSVNAITVSIVDRATYPIALIAASMSTIQSRDVYIKGSVDIAGLADTALVASTLNQTLDVLTQFINGKSRVTTGLQGIVDAMTGIDFSKISKITDVISAISESFSTLDAATGSSSITEIFDALSRKPDDLFTMAEAIEKIATSIKLLNGASSALGVDAFFASLSRRPTDFYVLASAISNVTSSIQSMTQPSESRAVDAFFASFASSANMSVSLGAFSDSITKMAKSMKDAMADINAYKEAIKQFNLLSKVDTATGSVSTTTTAGLSVAAAKTVVGVKSKAAVDAQKLVDASGIKGAKDEVAYEAYKKATPVPIMDKLSNMSALNSMSYAAGESGDLGTAVSRAKYLKGALGSNTAFAKEVSYLRGYNDVLSHTDKVGVDLLDSIGSSVAGDVDSYNLGVRSFPLYPNGAVDPRAARAANDALKRLQDIYNDPTSEINTYYSYLSGFNSASKDAQFATGGAFTNSVVDRPTSFNMGLMGESGSEAIMPLHNIGGSLGIRAIFPASNDSSNDNTETIAELKESNRQLGAVITVLQGKLDQILQENRKQTEALDSMQSTARVNSKVAVKR